MRMQNQRCLPTCQSKSLHGITHNWSLDVEGIKSSLVLPPRLGSVVCNEDDPLALPDQRVSSDAHHSRADASARLERPAQLLGRGR